MRLTEDERSVLDRAKFRWNPESEVGQLYTIIDRLLSTGAATRNAVLEEAVIEVERHSDAQFGMIEKNPKDADAHNFAGRTLQVTAALIRALKSAAPPQAPPNPTGGHCPPRQTPAPTGHGGTGVGHLSLPPVGPAPTQMVADREALANFIDAKLRELLRDPAVTVKVGAWDIADALLSSGIVKRVSSKETKE